MPPPRGPVQWLDHALHADPLWKPRARLLVAVSGGADSVALLRLLAAMNGSNHWRCELIVGHVDHGLRGRESAADARFAGALAKKLKLPCIIKKVKLPKDASEDAARVARLAALGDMVRRRKCAGVVLAHHADDHAETVLMKLFRGTGLEGLAGIARCTEVGGLTIYRPLLDLRRRDLRDYLVSIGQEWREDRTNAAPRYLRNRVRAELIPVVEDLAPQAIHAIRRMSRTVDDVRHFLRDTVASVWKAEATVARNGLRVMFPRLALRTWNAVAAELLRRAIEHVGGTTEIADHERVREAIRLIKAQAGGKVVQMGSGVTIHIGKDVTIEREPPVPPRRRRRL
jgi:tRNA(Ile)-lysidine synthase